MATHTSLASLFSDIATAIRSKTGSSAAIVADGFPAAIASIPTGAVDVKTMDAEGGGSLSWTGLLGEPKAFFIHNTQSSLSLSSTTKRLICVYYDGETTYGVFAYKGTSNGIINHTSNYYSWTYSNGTLTANCSSTSNGGSFTSGNHYMLLYVY